MATLRAAPWAIVVATASAALLAQTSVTGTWEMEMRWPDGQTSTGTCVFEQKGDALSGTCGGGTDRFPATGRVAGGDVSWVVDIKQGGPDAAMDFTGKLDGSGTAIVGTCRIVGVQGGTFTMKRK